MSFTHLLFISAAQPPQKALNCAFGSGAFTVGSIVWDDVGGGWTAWLGATIFEFGALFGLWEAWNRGNTANFGWGVKKITAERRCPRQERREYTRGRKLLQNAEAEMDLVLYEQKPGAATIFWISGFTAIPTIQKAIMHKQDLLDWVFWTPQFHFLSAFFGRTIIMIETQKKCYLPAPTYLGWHVGFWNLAGGVGFALCGALGYELNSSTKIAYQSSCSTFWGGWAFWIGSVIQ
ncbi:hypothetical protein B0H19DRAFT_1266743 [Mycena capillaripes]|nr:hypothetical protein B0H19DRAFT_1266743 [Mycena capillaripes]